MSNPFRIDVLDSNGDKLSTAEGPIVNVSQLLTVGRLDRIGDATFTMPATDPRAGLIQAGRQFDIYARGEGFVGRYFFRSSALNADGRVLTVKAWDRLRELTRFIVLFNRTYSGTPVAEIVANLLTLVTGWTSRVDDNIGIADTVFQGETLLRAIDTLTKRWSSHYRLVEPRQVQVGAFGADSGIRLVNLEGQVQPNLVKYTEIALVKPLQVMEEDDEIFNRVFPFGGGQGVSEITMEGATAGSYTLKSKANPDGSLVYYIEDTTSIASVGVREKVIKFSEIVPTSATPAARTAAADALKFMAENFIQIHLASRITYRASSLKLDSDLLPGDTVQLVYRGVVVDQSGDPYKWIDVDQTMFVLDIARRRAATGKQTVSLIIASLAERQRDDAELIVQVVKDVRALKHSAQPIAAQVSPGPYLQDPFDSTTPFEVDIQLGTNTIAVSSAALRIVTNNPDGGTWPQNISLFIDAVDRTSALGGPWTTTDVRTDVTLDVTQYLQGAVDNTYTIKLTCTTGVGSVQVEVTALVTIHAQ